MNKQKNYVDTIENAIIDYCIQNKTPSLPFSVFELSVHIDEYLKIKDAEI